MLKMDSSVTIYKVNPSVTSRNVERCRMDSHVAGIPEPVLGIMKCGIVFRASDNGDNHRSKSQNGACRAEPQLATLIGRWRRSS